MRYGYIDEATSLALLFNQDLDIIFDSLVDKYLAALTTEQEDLTGKDRTNESSRTLANKFRSASTLLSLQNYLDRYDNAESNYRYRLEVVERILSRNGDFNLQPWLTLHYLVCVGDMDWICSARCGWFHQKHELTLHFFIFFYSRITLRI